MKGPTHLLSHSRDELYRLVQGQAELHLAHNIGECRTRRDSFSKWLFQRGMLQAIAHGVDYVLENYPALENDKRPMGQILIEHQFNVVQTCQLLPYRAVIQWGLTELEDKLDLERESVICGVQHGLYTVAHTLPRLMRVKKKGPKLRALVQGSLRK